MSTTWKIRTLVTRKLNAIFAQPVMVATCYNACRIYEEKNPKAAEETRIKMQERGTNSFPVDHGTIVFVPRLRVFATMDSLRCADIAAKRAAVQLLSLRRQGIGLEEAIEETVGKVE